jgi:alpha-D-xyloside xylohydrolase
MNRVGTSVRLLQENRSVSVPVLLSSKGYGLFWDNPAVTEVDVAKSSPGVIQWSSEAGDSIDYYVFYGPEPDRVIAGYRTITGTVPMFPRWAWGLWQSRERYKTQEELLGVAREYRRRNIPLDGMVQDWQYWIPQPWGSHAFGVNFPDPKGMTRELHDEKLHLIISVWAKFDKGSKNYDELDKAGFLYPPIYPNVFPKGQAKWYDPFNPGARKMYWRQMSDELLSAGVDGWWLDATEPELGGKWGEFRDLKTAAGPGYKVFNAYPLMTTSAVYDGQRAERPNQRVFILTRSAWAGQQRNAAVTWSGDIQANWDTFRRQIPAGLNFVATGIPYWNTDIGGFFLPKQMDDHYRELFTR